MHLLAISMGHPSGSVVKESACNGGHQRLKNPLGQENLLEEEMATHSSILAWKKSHRQRSLVGYSPWGHKELDTTKRLSHHQQQLSVSSLRTLNIIPVDYIFLLKLSSENLSFSKHSLS